jgi:hypothetical protein
MVQEYEADWSSVRCPHDARPEFYVYSATAEDSLLTPKTGKTESACPATDSLNDVFKRNDVLYTSVLA